LLVPKVLKRGGDINPYTVFNYCGLQRVELNISALDIFCSSFLQEVTKKKTVVMLNKHKNVLLELPSLIFDIYELLKSLEK
jgi:hypothetical protein